MAVDGAGAAERLDTAEVAIEAAARVLLDATDQQRRDPSVPLESSNSVGCQQSPDTPDLSGREHVQALDLAPCPIVAAGPHEPHNLPAQLGDEKELARREIEQHGSPPRGAAFRAPVEVQTLFGYGTEKGAQRCRHGDEPECVAVGDRGRPDPARVAHGSSLAPIGRPRRADPRCAGPVGTCAQGPAAGEARAVLPKRSVGGAPRRRPRAWTRRPNGRWTGDAASTSRVAARSAAAGTRAR